MSLARLLPDHTDLRAAMARAEEAMCELETLQEEGGPKPSAKDEGERQRHYFLGTVRTAWDSFRTPLEAHMKHEELVLPGLVQRMEVGKADASELMATLRPLAEQHERLHVAAGQLRRAVLGIEPVRRPIDGAVAAFLRHAEVEDTRSFPLLARHMGLEYLPPSTARYSNDAHLGQALRSNLRSPPPVAPQRPTLLARLRTALGVRPPAHEVG